ncbi:hypothetical protein O181_103554 [Austropuccinia psidii MF-1]|uniref:Uncharacterized protein n=1 Tax=Austropuccinia psidii MF-1 TaxID=1389203 RepID=A0A9Q3PJC2_9BASI|nr:hypothetical protein [Austropuccinia psidii MF-1]
MKDITNKIKNPPDQEPHVNEASKEENSMEDVLDHPRELSEAVHPPKKVWKDKQNTQGSVLAPIEQQFRPRNTQARLTENYQCNVPAQNFPRPSVKFHYCLANGQSLKRCSYLAEDMEKRIVFVGREEYLVMPLVNTDSKPKIITEGAEIKASIPNGKLDMNMRVIGGHTKSLIVLA